MVHYARFFIGSTKLPINDYYRSHMRVLAIANEPVNDATCALLHRVNNVIGEARHLIRKRAASFSSEIRV